MEKIWRAKLIDASKAWAGIAIKEPILLNNDDQIRYEFDKVGEMSDVNVI